MCLVRSGSSLTRTRCQKWLCNICCSLNAGWAAVRPSRSCHLSRVWRFGQLCEHKAIWKGSGSTAPVPEQDDILDFHWTLSYTVMNMWATYFWSGVHPSWNLLQPLSNVMIALKMMKHYKLICKNSEVTWGEGHWYWPDGSCKRIGHAWVGQDKDCTGEAAPKESNVHPLKDRKLVISE